MAILLPMVHWEFKMIELEKFRRMVNFDLDTTELKKISKILANHTMIYEISLKNTDLNTRSIQVILQNKS